MRKKALKKEAIPEIEKPGIYAIHNKITDKYYIGSSVNVYERMNTHRININKCYLNAKMIEDCKKYGPCSFEFLVLKTFEYDKITEGDLRGWECKYIKEYAQNGKSYNIKQMAHTTNYQKENELVKKPKKTKITKSKNTHEKKEYDRITFVVPKGTKERIKATGKTANALINSLVAAYLKEMENTCPF